MSGTLQVEIEKRYPDAVIRAAFSHQTIGGGAIALYGPSGCGKTTVLRCLAGLAKPDVGRVGWGDLEWSNADTGVFVPPQKRQVGFLFQDYALFPHLTVAQNIGYGLRSGAATDNAVDDIMERFRIAGLGHRRPGTLSGGQQQRVALARAVIRNPNLLLLDEPLSALDGSTRQVVRRELREMLRESGVPVLLVTHDPVDVVSLADRVVVMKDGDVLQQGPVSEVFSRPANLHVAEIVGVETVTRGEVVSVEAGLATVRVGTALVRAALREPVQGRVDVCIRAEDVMLVRGDVGQASAQNHWPGRVVSIASEGPVIRVGLDVGFALTALISKPAREQLGLAEGQTVAAMIKATAIHVLPGR